MFCIMYIWYMFVQKWVNIVPCLADAPLVARIFTLLCHFWVGTADIFYFSYLPHIGISSGAGMSVIGVTRRLFLSHCSLNSI